MPATAGVAVVERAEGAHVAFGDGEKQRLVARAAVHALTVASPARKSFTPRREFPPGLRINSLSSTEFLPVKDDRSSAEVIAGQ